MKEPAAQGSMPVAVQLVLGFGLKAALARMQQMPLIHKATLTDLKQVAAAALEQFV
jgi:hypothetical protein